MDDKQSSIVHHLPKQDGYKEKQHEPDWHWDYWGWGDCSGGSSLSGYQLDPRCEVVAL